MTKNLSPEQEETARRACERFFDPLAPPVQLILPMPLVMNIIGNIQLALRHPLNTGPARKMVEKFALQLIEGLDPQHGDVYQTLMLGFDEKYDHPEAADFSDAGQDFIECRRCQKVVAVVEGKCSVCGERVCLYCGCTESCACDGGCEWTKENVCSTCAGKGAAG